MPRSALRGFFAVRGGGVSILYSITRRLISRSNSRRLPAIVRISGIYSLFLITFAIKYYFKRGNGRRSHRAPIPPRPNPNHDCVGGGFGMFAMLRKKLCLSTISDLGRKVVRFCTTFTEICPS